MAAPLVASMPQFLDLAEGYTLRVTALDATTGLLVAGVQVGVVTIEAVDVSDTGAQNPPPLPAALLGYQPGPN